MTDLRTAACVMLTEDVGISARQFTQLALTVETPEDLWTAPPDALQTAGGLTVAQTKKLTRAQQRQTEIIVRIDDLVAGGVDVVSCFDATYYQRLLKLTDPPPRLYRQGQTPPASRYLFVTGSNEVDSELVGWAVKTGKAVADLDLGVVSTLYSGIEAGVHVGALAQQGSHLVFLPGGLHQIEPADHIPLCEQIKDFGALVAPHAPDQAPDERSRVDAARLAVAMSHAVLFIDWEPESSYAQRTLNQAETEGTPVFYLAGGSKDQATLRAAGAYPVADVESLDLILQYC